MKTDFFNKLKTGTLLVITKPSQLHVMKLLEDYNKDSFFIPVFLKYRYSAPYAEEGGFLNCALKDETANRNAYIVKEEF